MCVIIPRHAQVLQGSLSQTYNTRVEDLGTRFLDILTPIFSFTTITPSYFFLFGSPTACCFQDLSLNCGALSHLHTLIPIVSVKKALSTVYPVKTLRFMVYLMHIILNHSPITAMICRGHRYSKITALFSGQIYI